MDSIVTGILDNKKIEYEIKLHSRKVFTSIEAAEERGVKLSQIVKCMIVKTPMEMHVLALLPGDKKLLTAIWRYLWGWQALLAGGAL